MPIDENISIEEFEKISHTLQSKNVADFKIALRKSVSGEVISQKEADSSGMKTRRNREDTTNIHTRKNKFFHHLAKETAGYSGADLESLCREAGLFALRKDINADTVTAEDFAKAIKEINPSLTSEMNEFYEATLQKRKKQVLEEEIGYMG